MTSLTTLHPLLEKYSILRTPGGRLGDFDRTYRLQFSGEYDVGDHTVSFQVSRAATGLVTIRDFEYGIPRQPNAILATGTNIAVRDTYYEVRLTSPQDQKLRYLVGLSDYSQRYRLGNAPFANQLTPSSFPVVGNLPTVDFQDNTTLGIFGSIDYDITDDFTVSLEARYTDEESETLLQGNPNLACSFATVCNISDQNKDFIPRVILTYQPFDGASTYASYSYSSLLGVPTQAGFINSVAPEVIPDDQLSALGIYTPPQENEQWELGWKQQFENWAFTLAVFHIDWKNQPFASVIVLPQGGTTSYRGPGDSKYKGFDLEITGNPTDWLNLSATVGFSDGEMTNFSSRGSNESNVLGSGPLSVVNDGNDPRNQARWTLSFSPTLLGNFADRDWFLRTDVIYESGMWADYSEYNRVSDSLRLNMRAGVDVTESFKVEVYGTNITHDKTLPPTAGTTTGAGGLRKAFSALYRKPEFGVRLTSQF